MHFSLSWDSSSDEELGVSGERKGGIEAQGGRISEEDDGEGGGEDAKKGKLLFL